MKKEKNEADRKKSLQEKGKQGLQNREIPLDMSRRILAYEMRISAEESRTYAMNTNPT